MIIVEYCKHGNLVSYLSQMRNNFVMQKRKLTDDSDVEDGKIQTVHYDAHTSSDDSAFVDSNDEIR